jgi:hypothetical protein
MKRPSLRLFAFAAILVGLGSLLTGCGTVEGDARNAASRPWNAPKGWESGLPAGLNEGR